MKLSNGIKSSVFVRSLVVAVLLGLSLVWVVLSYGKHRAGQHPIDGLVRDARRRFAAKLSAQSRTLQQAERTYRQRYGLESPPLFAQWWEFAKQREHRLPDEYDRMMESLRPFLRLTGADVKRRAEQVSVKDLVRL